MPTILSLPVIGELLGHSIIYEEYKGNFALALQAALRQVSAARQRGEPGQLADALLAEGLVRVLQGETPAAVKCFEEMNRLSAHDPGRQLQAVACHKLATYQRYMAAPGGCNGKGTEVENGWDALAYAKSKEERWEQLVGQIRDGFTLPKPLQAYDLPVYRLVSQLPVLRSLPDGLITPPEKDMDDPRDAILTSIEQLRKQTEAMNGSPCILAQTDLIASQTYWRSGDRQRGLQSLEQAYEIYFSNGDLAGAATCLMTRGDRFVAPAGTPETLNHNLRANFRLSFVLRGSTSIEPDPDSIDLPAARSDYAEAANLFRAADAPRGLAALRLRDGYLAVLGSDFDLAEQHALEARSAFDDVGDALGAWIACTHQALHRIGAGKVAEDIANDRTLGNWVREGGSFNLALGLGALIESEAQRWLLKEGDHERSLACHGLAEKLFHELGATFSLASCLTNQGRDWDLLREDAAALAAHERAWNLYTEVIQTQPALAEAAWYEATLLGLAIKQVSLSRNDPDGMERAMARVRAILARPVVPTGPTPIDPRAGAAMKEMIDVESETTAVMAPLQRARSAQQAGESAEAENQFNLALTAAQASRHHQTPFLEAVVYGYWQRYPEAVDALKRHIAAGGFASNLARDFLTNLAGTVGQSIAATIPIDNYTHIARLFVKFKAYAEAKGYWDALEREAGQEWWLNLEQPWAALSDYGETLEELGNLEAALAIYDRAMAELETRRERLRHDQSKTALSGDSTARSVYFQAARCALKVLEQSHKAADATQILAHSARVIHYAERGKARGLLDLMAAGLVLGRVSPAQDQSVRDWRRLNNRLAIHRSLIDRQRRQTAPAQATISALEQQITTDVAEVRRVEADLASTTPDFHRLINPQAQIMSLEAVSASVPPDTALIQYYFLGDDLMIWAITRSQGLVEIRRTRLDAKTLDRKIRTFHRLCERRGQWMELADELAKTLLCPMAKAIDANPHLIIVPFGAAHSLPFHALPWAGHPLVATHSFCYLPSASTLQFLRAACPSSAPGPILAIGNPARMVYKPATGGTPMPLPPLPAAEVEAAIVSKMFPSGTALLGEQATSSEVHKHLGKYPILHFATHGYLSEESPLLSSILLSAGEDLQLSELMGLRLQADLVVLSACNTARGEATGGDDVLGLTRGLLGAGAGAAVVSLWSVNDLSTSLLMINFYRRLHEGPALALQAAQNDLRRKSPDMIEVELMQLKDRLESVGAWALVRRIDTLRDFGLSNEASATNDYSHPGFWAPFIFIGRPSIPNAVRPGAPESSVAP
jgi:CHAT domain-containing protein/tetratricopeptide (TPR) repeat protein